MRIFYDVYIEAPRYYSRIHYIAYFKIGAMKWAHSTVAAEISESISTKFEKNRVSMIFLKFSH